MSKLFRTILFLYLSGWQWPVMAQHIVTFCGEPVPMNQQYVQDKLINVIKKQVHVVNLPSLRQRANLYMPIVERYLAAYGLHADLKYLPIVESGFLTKAESGVGAKGIWQIMPATAKGYGLVVCNGVDEELKMKGTKSTELTSVQTKISADSKLELKSSAQASIEGVMLDVKGSGITNIQGALVKIN